MSSTSSSDAFCLRTSSTLPATSFIEAIQGRPQVTTLHVELGTPRIDRASLTEIFTALAHLPYLRSLRFYCLNKQSNPPALSAHTLATALSNAPGLTYLSLQDVGICGSLADYAFLSAVLRKHQRLKIIGISGCLPSEGSTSLEALLDALAEARLQEIVISNTMISVLGFRTRAAVSKFCCRSLQLEALSLKMLPEMQDKHLADFIEQTLVKDGKKLKRLTLHSYEVGFETCLALAHMLKVHEGLVRLDVSLSASLDDAIPIIKALRTPTSRIKELFFHVDLFRYVGDRKGFLDGILEMVKANFVLQEIRGIAWGASHLDIPFYLELNRLGRRELLSDCNEVMKEHWVNALISSRRDTKLAYYLLSENPSLTTACGNN